MGIDEDARVTATGRPYETLRITGEDGVGIAVDRWAVGAGGARPAFLLVHGLASNARLYDGVGAALEEAGHDVAALDLRGHGRSDKPDKGYDYETMCADVAGVIAALWRDGSSGSAQPVVAVGQSFGGNLVLELAARHPELVAGVVCIDGGTIDLSQQFQDWESVSAALSPPKLTGMPATRLRSMMAASHPDWPEAGIDAQMANFEVQPDGTVRPWLTLEHHLAILRTMWSSSPSALYPKLGLPVLLIPTDSPGAPAAWSEAKRDGVARAEASLPQPTVRWFSPADHDVHAQHPREVAEALLAWAAGSGLDAG